MLKTMLCKVFCGALLISIIYGALTGTGKTRPDQDAARAQMIEQDFEYANEPAYEVICELASVS